MARIPNEVIDDIRQRVKIEDVVGQYVQLTKRGRGYVCSCPFHEDNNPSFSIHTDKQIYKCFSCGRGGNVFGFIQEIESVPFIEAVKKIADFVNYPLDGQYLNDSGQSQIPKATQTLYQIYEKTNEFYHYYLTGTQNGEPALTYLTDRSLTTQVIDQFSLGLAPDNSQLLWTYLQDQSFSPADLLASGIFYQSEAGGEIFDRFRGRLIFPLRSQQGQVLAFSGRIFLPGDPRNSKYVNSPESEIFHKGRMLYNLDLARPAIRRLKQVIICEGYMDVISLYAAGFEQVVATMGTSLSQDHLSHLSKMCQEIIFVFDGDEAGQKATARAFEMATHFKNVQFKAVVLPEKMDPDEWLKRRGANAFQHLINRAQSPFSFYKDYQKQFFHLEDKQELANYIDQLLIFLKTIGSPVEQQLYLLELANEFSIKENFLEERMARLAPGQEDVGRKQGDQPTVSTASSPAGLKETSSLAIQSFKAMQSEKLLLGALMYYPQAWHFLENLEEMPYLYHDFSQKALLSLTDYYYQGHQLPLTGIVGNIEDTQVNNLLTSVMWEFEPLGYHERILSDCLQAIDDAFIEQEIDELNQVIKRFHQQQESDKALEAISRLMHLQRQMKKKE